MQASLCLLNKMLCEHFLQVLIDSHLATLIITTLQKFHFQVLEYSYYRSGFAFLKTIAYSVHEKHFQTKIFYKLAPKKNNTSLVYL